MAINLVNLVPGSVITNAQVSYYSPLNVAAKIYNATIYNQTGGPVVVTVWIVPSGGSVANSNLVFTRSIAAGITDLCPELSSKNLQNEDKLYAQAGSNTALTLMVSGIEVSAGTI